MNERIDKVLADIALFNEVARTKSVKRAGQNLGIPESTLSRRITDLEKLLGVRLLHRTTRRIELTEAGNIYYAQCKQIVQAAELARQQLKDLTETPEGRLRVSLPVDFSTLFLAPLIAEFAEAYPKITFDLTLSERWTDLMQESADVAIRLGLQPDSTLTARHLADVRHELYASPEYIACNSTPTQPHELEQHACIRLVCPHWGETWSLFKGSEEVQVRVGERIAVNNLALVRKFATLGLGIAPLDVLLAREDVEAGRLRRVLPDWHFNPVPVFALTLSKLLPAKTRIFLDFLGQRIKGRLAELEAVKGPLTMPVNNSRRAM